MNVPESTPKFFPQGLLSHPSVWSLGVAPYSSLQPSPVPGPTVGARGTDSGGLQTATPSPLRRLTAVFSILPAPPLRSAGSCPWGAARYPVEVAPASSPLRVAPHAASEIFIETSHGL